jgi:hypothetical protein
MMDEKALIEGIGQRLQGQAQAPARAGEIAGEVEKLNAAIRRAAARLTFDDEPAAFAALLARQAPKAGR